MQKESRHALGYHAVPGDHVKAAYRRDTMSAPLRDMCNMVRDIVARRFLPDASRSGRFSTEPLRVGGSDSPGSAGAVAALTFSEVERRHGPFQSAGSAAIGRLCDRSSFVSAYSVVGRHV